MHCNHTLAILNKNHKFIHFDYATLVVIPIKLQSNKSTKGAKQKASFCATFKAMTTRALQDNLRNTCYLQM